MIGLLIAMITAASTSPKILPVPLSHPVNYPAAAMLHGKGGIASVLLRIDAAGALSSCAITETSGSSDLDRVACDVFKASHFAPATDLNGTPVAGEIRTRMVWKAGNSPLSAKLPLTISVASLPGDYSGAARAVALFDGTGHASACQVVASSGSTALDATVCDHVTRELTVTPPKSASAEPPAASREVIVSFVGGAATPH